MIEFRLKEVMKERNIKLRELAEMTGLSTNTLSMLSTGRSKGIQFDTLDKILTFTKAEVGELIHHSGVYLDISVDIDGNVDVENTLRFNALFYDSYYVLEVKVIHYKPNDFVTLKVKPNDNFKKHQKFFNQSIFQLISTLMIKEIVDNDMYHLIGEPRGMLLFDWTNIFSFGYGLPVAEVANKKTEEIDRLVYKEARKFPGIKIKNDIISIPFSSIDFVLENEASDEN